MLFCDIYYVSKDAAYIKKNSEVILFVHIVAMFVIVELQTWNAILLKYTANYNNYTLRTGF
jgi:hypothetical protein